MPNLPLLRSLFQSRTDVFATRWEQGNKSGYMPAYQYDPYLYRQHKMKGGAFKDYQEKTYLPLTDEQIEKHLQGEQFIGIYPLLQDNTSWFLAADFDDKGWEDASRRFIQICAERQIPVYLERSRSGNGGHAWIFFEQNYPAVKSRKVFIHLLEQAKVISTFDKNASFDRLFPNQDTLSGKGLGNLIALPLHGEAIKNGNTCFIDPNSLVAYPDQWVFLSQIQRVAISILEDIHKSVNPVASAEPTSYLGANPLKISIYLDTHVRINKPGISEKLRVFIKDEFNFPNSEFYVKQKSGKNTWDTERYFNLIEENEQEVILPRGGIGKILRFCRDQQIDFDFQDLRPSIPWVSFSSNIHLREDQVQVIEATQKKDFGVIVAPPGTGKTVMALQIIAEKQQPALILVHRKQLAEQWKERINAFLGIPNAEIGTIGQGKLKAKEKITIATIQSLSKRLEKGALTHSFGTIIIDECHHIPAKTYRTLLAQLPTRYLYGLTATPYRKFSDGKLIFLFLGEIIAELAMPKDAPRNAMSIKIRETNFEVPFNPKTDRFEVLSKILVHDSARNELVLKDARGELDRRKKVVLLTERREHIESLHQYLKSTYEVITLSGEDSEISRKAKWLQLQQGHFQVLITTGQLFGEGMDLANLDCLFLCYPFSFEGKLVQYIGRVQRGESLSKIYDYNDIQVPYLHRMFLKRNAYYRKLAKQQILMDDPEDVLVLEKSQGADTIEINLNIKLPLDAFEFQYGSVQFSYLVTELEQTILFEIENLYIRPELEVLKPYFTKILSIKQIEVQISVIQENRKIIAQNASAPDLGRINQEIIDGVKFRFIEHQLRSMAPTDKDKMLLDVEEMQKQLGGNPDLYASGEELLHDFLQDTKVKHYAQLRYLANQHERQILKLRFVLSPFSFVFLLAGEEQYHLVLETLDTEEATYIWHLPKDRHLLKANIKEIDQTLNMIQKLGRKYFLNTNPVNFSRVLHDYTESKKGFIVWKDNLEALIC